MKCCSIIGHRKIQNQHIVNALTEKVVRKLLTEMNVSSFLFGSKSNFNDICYDIVSKLKPEYPFIKRIYVRAEYPYVSAEYMEYLNTLFEESYYFNSNSKSSKLNYIKRNEHIIDNCDLCLFYFDKNYVPTTKTNSGTHLAYNYAIKKKKEIINVFDML